MSKLAFYGKTLAAIGVATLVVVVILNHFQFFLYNQKGLLPKDFEEAIVRGDINTIKRYLEQGIDVNTATCGSAETIFHSLFQDDCGKREPLVHRAISLGANQEIMEFLIARGANVNARNAQGKTVLHILPSMVYVASTAFGKNMAALGEVLIVGGADINAQDNEGKTILENALCHPYDNFSDNPNSHLLDFVKLLVDKGADLNAINTQSGCATPLLHQAATFNNKKLVNFALAQGIDVNTKNQKEKTPLHYARGQDAAEILIANKANVNARSNADKTPLEAAICIHRSYKLKKEVVRFLLANGADINALNPKSICGNRELSLLNEAVVSDIGELVELALKKGGNVNSSDRKGKTPLHHASKFNALEAAKILLTNGADINARDDKGYTSLHMAAIHRNPEIAQLLIDRDADVNAVNKEGRTPLYEAKNFFWYPVSEWENEPQGTQETINILKRAGGVINR